MRSVRQSFRLLAALPFAVLVGCYDGEALLRDARSTALSTRLAEIDLGTFQTSLPRVRQDSALTELELHVFGAVPRYRLSAVKKQLKRDEFRLRHDTLAAIRCASNEELSEPSLTQLRQRIEHVVNGILTDSPIKGVGFYQVTLHQ